jgi:hypothetical protein
VGGGLEEGVAGLFVLYVFEVVVAETGGTAVLFCLFCGGVFEQV